MINIKTIAISLFLFFFVPYPCLGDKNKHDELTGIFHKEYSKIPNSLEIDGSSSTLKEINLAGDIIKNIPDGARIWVKGDLKSWRIPPPGTKDMHQQQPTRWCIVMLVEEYKIISKPFEIPKN